MTSKVEGGSYMFLVMYHYVNQLKGSSERKQHRAHVLVKSYHSRRPKAEAAY